MAPTRSSTSGLEQGVQQRVEARLRGGCDGGGTTAGVGGSTRGNDGTDERLLQVGPWHVQHNSKAAVETWVRGMSGVGEWRRGDGDGELHWTGVEAEAGVGEER